MPLLIIAGIIVILSLVGVGVTLIRFKSKLKTFKGTQYDKSELDSIDNTQDLLPFKSIHTNRVDLGNYRTVAYLRVSPFNYLIQSSDGKRSFAIRLRRAINTIDFRYLLFTHTRPMTNEKMLRQLGESLDNTTHAHPELKAYADEYFELMSTANVVNPETGSLRTVKDYFIVIPWEPSKELGQLSDAEVEFRAREGIRSRIHTMKEALKQAGIESQVLNTIEVIELLTSVYRREETNRADLLFDGGYQSVFVEGDKDSKDVPDLVRLTSVLEGARAHLNQDVISNAKVSGAVREKGLKLSEHLAGIERKLKGQS